MTRKLTSTVLAAGALLAIAPAADAATTFGSRLNHDPANSGECVNLMGPCTIAAFIHPSDPDGDPYSGGAPVDGVITKFRTRIVGEGGAAATVTLKLAEVSRTDPQNDDTAVAQLVGTGPTVTIPENNSPDVPILEFPASLPVKKGQQLALEGTNMWATVNNSGDKYSYVYSPPLVAGQGPRGSTDATGELLVQADVESDVDGDGLGDQTQDPAVGKPGNGADTSAPRLSRLSLAPAAFRSSSKLGYSLSEAAKVSIRIERRTKNGRFARLRGALSDSGEAGKNTKSIKRRLAGRRLAAGRYRLVIKATDDAGNISSAQRIGFRIKR
jgi:hypothetical protein